MVNKKKVLIGMIIIVAILIVLHISINYLLKLPTQNLDIIPL